MIGHQNLLHIIMMTSSNGNIFRVTDHLCGEFTIHGEIPAQRPVTRNFDVFFNRHRAHYDVTVMFSTNSLP